MIFEQYYQVYEKLGFRFDRGLLTSYCLSLRTKPFVILSGISGTGKTKIAQLFDDFEQKINAPVVPLPELTSMSGRWIIMTVTDGVINSDGRGNFKYSDLGALLSDSEMSDIQPRIDELRKLGMEDNICDPFEFSILTPDGTVLKAMAYLQRASNPLLRVRFKSKRGEPDYNSTTYFAKHYKVGTRLKLEKIGDKKLKIVSVDDESVLMHAKAIDVVERPRVQNKCFVSVRSDWTDSTPLLGYFNMMDQRYHLTQTLVFILTAHENPDVPFFLVLDEMNLARVEHYFSDFLSCLESRYLDGDVLKQEPIRLHSDSCAVETNNSYFDTIAPTVSLPANLYVTGTVNIDESTYMFSSKVLDRANVIELNDVDLTKYSDKGSFQSSEGFLLENFPSFSKFELPTMADFHNLPASPRDVLISIHEILVRHNLHFGYRVVNEVSRYVLNVSKYCSPSSKLLLDAMDRQLMQKVFPKFAGGQSKLDLPIREVLNFLVNGVSGQAMATENVENIAVDQTDFPQSVAKLKRMHATLALNGFTNFIE